MDETTISYSETTIWDPEAYDAPRRRLVPDFDRFYGTAAELVAGLGLDRPDVLDLGAGTGILTAAVREAVPGARLTVLDGAAPMVAVARQRLGDVTTVVADLTDPLPVGPFDAVVSALAVHHLSDEGKRDLFARVLAELRPGGVFVNAEQVAGPTPWHQARYEAAHERDARALGTDDAEWEAALARMAHDRCATVDDQVAWLAAAGFERTDVAFKRYRFAVYFGFAPEGQSSASPWRKNVTAAEGPSTSS
ncbi:MAG: Methyltransferase [Actinomycetia bacterium]|nr:Methyltransferase [Actinomycetes bacterium]